MGVVTVTVPPGRKPTTIIRRGNNLFVGKFFCAHLADLDSVQVDGSSGRNVAGFDLEGGLFVNPETTLRIPFHVHLGRRWDKVVVLGTDHPDVITAGDNGVDFTGDHGRHIDVTMDGVERYVVLGEAGDDRISAHGDEVTGSSLRLRGRTTFWGGLGDDVLQGSGGSRHHQRTSTANVSRTICPANPCQGTTDADNLHGGKGNDTIYGYAGADELYGGRDNDTIDGGVGPFHDTCYGGRGQDTLTNCEEVHGLP